MKIHILIIFYIIIIFTISKCSTIINENELTKIETKSKNYTLYSLSENKNNSKYINIQIFICEKNNNETSYFSILNLTNSIFEKNINSSEQFSISIKNINNLKLNITSPRLFLNYQYTNTNKTIKSKGLIKSAYLISNNIEINLSPVLINYSTNYQLFSLNKNLTDQSEILEYTIKNQSIQNQTLNETKENFNLDFKNILIEDKFIFIKGIGIDNISYIYLYNIVEIKTQKIIFWVILVIALIFVIIVIVLILLKKKEIIYKNKNNYNNNINESLIE